MNTPEPGSAESRSAYDSMERGFDTLNRAITSAEAAAYDVIARTQAAQESGEYIGDGADLYEDAMRWKLRQFRQLRKRVIEMEERWETTFEPDMGVATEAAVEAAARRTTG